MRLLSDFALGVMTVWAEARGESFAGKIAVGNVIRNRCAKAGKSVAEIVLAKGQFSCFWWKDPNFIPAHVIDDTDLTVKLCADAWLRSEETKLVEDATIYYADSIEAPEWVERCEFVAQIGRHTFYREK